MTIITDLTDANSDSDNDTNKKSSSSRTSTVTPNKDRKHHVQTTIEKAIMRGHSSGRLCSHEASYRNNWDSYNTMCDNKFIYHQNSSFAAPAYDTTTMSHTIHTRKSLLMNVPMVNCATADENVNEYIETDSSNEKDSGEIVAKRTVFEKKSKITCDTNEERISNSTMCNELNTNDNELMSAYLSKNETIGDIKELLFTTEFKTLYDFSQCTNGILPEIFASVD